MPVKELTGSEREMRVGAQALSLLSAPRNCLILRALAEKPRRQVELRRASGFPAQTTLRGHLKALEDAEAVSKQVREPFPAVLEYRLEDAGVELLFVAGTLGRWLAEAPQGPFELGSDAAKGAIKSLIDSWSSTMLHDLATGRRTLTELDNSIAGLNYPSIERRLGAMRISGQIEALPAESRGTPYEVTDWVRRGIAPLVAAARWEHRHLRSNAPPVRRLDAETAFLLTVPLLQLPRSASGSCKLTVELPKRGREGRGGLVLEVKGGKVKACATDPLPDEDGCDAWATGKPDAWFGAIIDGELEELCAGGDQALSAKLLAGFRQVLFPS